MGTRLKTVIRYVTPSVAAMLVNFLYVVVDGIFVGQGVGMNALAAVNIAIPFTTGIIALMSMIVMGGASVTAIRFGRGDDRGANDAFLNCGVLLIIAAVAMTIVGVAWPGGVARVSGASDLLMQDTIDYIRYYCLFTVVNGLAMYLSNFVRNDGRPGLSFAGMVAGALSNVFLDWLFVFPLQMGIKGAAIASGLGQFLALAILATHFLRRRGSLRIRRFSMQRTLVGKIIKRGLPELVTQLSQPVTIICYNYVVMRAFGEVGVAAFSAISYLVTLILGVFLGVSQGLQPLMGNSFGSKDKASERFYLRSGLVINLALSGVIYMALMFGGRSIIGLFNSDARMIELAYDSVLVYGFSFLLASLNIVLTTYFFSTKRTPQATAIAVSRSLILNTLCILSFPMLFGSGAIWYAAVVAEGITVVLGFTLLWRSNRHTQSVSHTTQPPVLDKTA